MHDKKAFIAPRRKAPAYSPQELELRVLLLEEGDLLPALQEAGEASRGGPKLVTRQLVQGSNQ